MLRENSGACPWQNALSAKRKKIHCSR
ncbi:hypothetical protein [Methanosarcina sp. KYL-1]